MFALWPALGKIGTWGPIKEIIPGIFNGRYDNSVAVFADDNALYPFRKFHVLGYPHCLAAVGFEQGGGALDFGVGVHGVKSERGFGICQWDMF